MLHNTEIFEYSIIFLILFCVIVIIVTTVNFWVQHYLFNFVLCDCDYCDYSEC